MLRAGMVALVLVLAAQSQASAKELTIEGRLGRTVESGGWLIKTAAQKFLILNAQKFRSESWFREDAEVEAIGETRTGVVTIHQEGTPFEARSMRAQTSGGAVTGGASERGRELTRVVVSGDAVVQSQPDTAILSLAVVTENLSASEAQAENASKTEAVVRAVKAAAGPGAEVKTSGYTLQPQYIYQERVAPKISGYTARNSVSVTMGDLTRVGAVIDAASRAGANTVDSLSFTLRRDQQARTQALTEATREALSKARVIAEALGGRVVRVVEVQEAGTYRPPVPVYEGRAAGARLMAADAAQTPVEVGSLDIRAQVQVVAEIETRQ
jgi:uncharacterized protein YggE